MLALDTTSAVDTVLESATMHHNVFLYICAALPFTTLVSAGGCYTTGQPGNSGTAKKYVDKVCDDYMVDVYTKGQQRSVCLPEDHHHWQFTVKNIAAGDTTLSKDECVEWFKEPLDQCKQGGLWEPPGEPFTYKYVLHSCLEGGDPALTWWIVSMLIAEPARGILSRGTDRRLRDDVGLTPSIGTLDLNDLYAVFAVVEQAMVKFSCDWAPEYSESVDDHYAISVDITFSLA